MINKIVILDDSVLLYEHYISNDEWERTLAFPRGGLTYLISNGTIKFYAYEDYFYRNCLISMQLPIYVVDEKRHIDGEYDNINDLVRVLDPIFPSNDIDAELEFYLTIADAERLYQPIGDYVLKSDIPDMDDYVTDEELVEALEDYYTKSETSGATQISTALADKLDTTAYTPCDLSNYYTKSETSGATQISTALGNKQDTLVSGTNIKTINNQSLLGSGNITIEGGGSGGTVDAYTKAESDARFQPKGDYALRSEIPDLDGYATESWVENKKYITSASTVFNNYYTTANTYSKTEIDNIIANLQEQIANLSEALEECCSCDTQYRWVTLTGSSDYLCDYETHTKYEKQQKQESTNCGRSWQNVEPAEYQRGNIIETDSIDCGYTPEGELLIMTDSTGGTYTLYCGYQTEYLDVHGMKNFTYYDGISATTISGFLPQSTWQTIKEVELGECLETLGGQVFMDYSGLTTVTIPNTLKSLSSQGYGNFENCVALESITIPDSVYYIGDGTFKGCTSLTSVTIGSGIEEINDNSFSGCTSLTSITINATTPPYVNDVTFADTNNCPIYVPSASVDTYKSATNWSTYYSDRIYPISELNS